jgi:hypothetical protein
MISPASKAENKLSRISKKDFSQLGVDLRNKNVRDLLIIWFKKVLKIGVPDVMIIFNITAKE